MKDDSNRIVTHSKCFKLSRSNICCCQQVFHGISTYFRNWCQLLGDHSGLNDQNLHRNCNSTLLRQNKEGEWGDKPIFWDNGGIPQSPPPHSLGETLQHSLGENLQHFPS